MKSLACLLGIIIPGVAIRALAQEIKASRVEDHEKKDQNGEVALSQKEKSILNLYESCTHQEKATFIYKVIATKTEADLTATNKFLIQEKIEDILRLDKKQQEKALLEQIRQGGIRWGSIGNPSDGSR